MKRVIIYDFDGTLTPYRMPRFEVMRRCGLRDGSLDDPDFLSEVKELMRAQGIDKYQALYEVYLRRIREAGMDLMDENLCLGANDAVYRDGVEEFLRELVMAGVDNFLLSSGIKVFLERVGIAKYFKEIYATTFTYENGVIIGVKYLMSDQSKVEAIKDIVKSYGCDEDDCRGVIYVGDGATDSHAMKYVKDHGGVSVFVYDDRDDQDLKTLEEAGAVSYSARADFSRGSELYKYLRKELINEDQ